jgi:hypothetical protein
VSDERDVGHAVVLWIVDTHARDIHGVYTPLCTYASSAVHGINMQLCACAHMQCQLSDTAMAVMKPRVCAHAACHV